MEHLSKDITLTGSTTNKPQSEIPLRNSSYPDARKLQAFHCIPDGIYRALAHEINKNDEEGNQHD